MIKREIQYSYHDCKVKLMFIGLLFIFINSINVNLCLQNFDIMNIVTADQYFFYIFKGAKYINNIQQFTFPTVWLLSNMLIIFINGSYFKEQLSRNSLYIITRCGRKKLWINKLSCTLLNIFYYYFVIFIITYFAGIIFFKGSMDANVYFDVIVLYVFTSTMFTIVINTLCLVMDLKYASLVCIIVLFLSIFSRNGFMPGQQSILLRHMPYDKVSNLTILKSFVYCVVVSIIAFFIGMKIIENKDIY